jgi:transposase
VVSLQTHQLDRRTHLLKTTGDYVNIIDAYHELGSYRAAAELCGTTDKTVKRALDRQAAGGPWLRRPRVLRHNTEAMAGVIAEKVKDTDGRITAKRLLPVARAAGYQGSARNFRRAVSAAKSDWRRRRRSYRPWVPSPGQHLVIDWADAGGGLQMFCAVLAWSRYRFVRFAPNQTRETTLSLLAECFGELGAVPAVVLSDRMGCLKNGVVANLVVPHPDYVRFAAHFGFRPDFCEAADPESKGLVENLVAYAKLDLVVPAEGWGGRVADANRQAKVWGLEVNGRVHSETQAVPAARLHEERPLMRALPSLRPPLCRGELRKVGRLQTVRFASARYSLPSAWLGKQVEVSVDDDEVVIAYDGREIERHPLMAPGEISIKDEHYQGAARRPFRAIRVRTASERAFICLGPVAEAFLRAAAAAGSSRLAAELAEIVSLEASWGREQLVAALERATRFRRFKADDLRDILAAGPQAPNPVSAGRPLHLALPEAPVRSLEAYALEAIR